jgi:hypothetical protein
VLIVIVPLLTAPFAVDNTMLPVLVVPDPVDSVNVPPVDPEPDATPDVIVTDPPVILS